MKRTPLTRRKPKYPSAAQLRERRAWGQEQTHCHLCLERMDLDIHEIASRGQCSQWCRVENFLALCRHCHAEHASWLPESFQMALKLLADGTRFDRVLLNRMRGRDDNAVTDGEVKSLAKLIQSLRGER